MMRSISRGVLLACYFSSLACGGSGQTDSNPVGPVGTPPMARFVFSPIVPHQGEEVTFSAGISSDPDGSIESYVWAFGDGTTGSGREASHVFTSPGPHEISLTVADDDGATGTASETIEVLPPNLPPVASYTFTPAAPERGQEVVFDGVASTDPDGAIVLYDWDFGDGTSLTGGRSPGSSATHFYDAAGTFMVTLSVMDDDGARSEAHQVMTIGSPSILSFSPVAGTWEGTAVEVSLISFTIDATIQPSALRGEVAGSVVYDGGVCEGDWKAVDVVGSTYTMRELITAGNCPDGIVTLTYDAQADELSYDFKPIIPRSIFEAHGTLMRKL